MSNRAGIQQPARAQPLADLSIEPLLGRGETLARLWATALVLSRPLDRIGEIPLEEIALRGPHLCVGVLRALRSTAELEVLTGAERGEGVAGAPVAAMSGAADAASAADAVELLRGVLWEALAGELLSGRAEVASARRLADAGDRLAYVCSALLGACLAGARQEQARAAGDGPEIGVSRPAGGLRPPAARTVARRGPPSIVDEGAAPAAVALRGAQERPAADGAEIEIRDQRGGEGAAAWIGSIGRRLERFHADGRPFAVLLLELGDLARLARDRPARAASGLEADVEALLAGAVGGADAAPQDAHGLGTGARGSLTRERPGRYWLLVPGADRAGGRELAQRLTRAVSRLLAAAGAPGPASVGTASCPQDGTGAAALAAHADVDLCAARSAAREAATAREAVGPGLAGPERAG